MKNTTQLLLFVLLCCCFLPLSAQQEFTQQNTFTPIEKHLHSSAEPHICGTAPMTQEERRYTLDVVDKQGVDLRNMGTTCLPLRIHIVSRNDGSGGISLDEINIGMSYLNAFYYDAAIEYYICSVNYINSTAWYDFSTSEESAMRGAHLVDDAINIFFVNSITTSSGGRACGYAYYPANSDRSLTILMDNDCTASWPNGTLVHELGHTFNLAHTHSGTERGNTNSNAEHVPRSGANSNCTTDGDMLCDTPADPNGSNDSNCNFVNDGNSQQDIYGNTYAPAINNVMSYYSDACGGILTPDQYTRIANALITRQGHSAYNLTGCGPTNVTNASNLTAAISASYTVDLNWMDNANNETGYLIERSEDNGLTWKAVVGGGVAPDVTTFVDDTAEGNRTYQYRVKASNDNCNDYSNVATINTGALYCIPSHQSNSCTVFGTRGVAIYDFQMRESGGGTTLINNNNNACNGPLSVYTASYSANVMPGSSYEVEVDFRFGGSGSYTTQNIAIWVDLDQNGSFTDAGEMLYQSTPSNASTIIAPFTIPANAMAGSTTLRVRSGFSGNGLMTDPCNYRAFSEAEDYGIVIGSANGVEVNVKAFLQGAFDVSGLMRDDLRVAGYIPMTEPYTNLAGFTHIDGGGEMVQSNVLNVTGNDAIVDWVFLELRDKNSPSTVLHTRSALLQRDGDIVDVDGGSTPVRFDMAPPDDYYIVVRHRNHLAVRTPAVQSLSATASTYDFSTGSGQAVGTEPMAQPTAGVFAMWGGNAKADDNYVRVTPRVFPPPSLASDRTYILDDILSGDPNGTYMGYSTGDVNMDGIVRITPRVFPPPTIPSDATYIIDNILDGDPNATRTEQQ